MEKKAMLILLLLSLTACSTHIGIGPLHTCEEMADMLGSSKKIQLPREVEAVLIAVSDAGADLPPIRFVKLPNDSVPVLICTFVSSTKPFDFKSSWHSFETKESHSEGLFMKTEVTNDGLYAYFIGIDCQKVSLVIRENSDKVDPKLKYIPFSIKVSTPGGNTEYLAYPNIEQWEEDKES